MGGAAHEHAGLKNMMRHHFFLLNYLRGAYPTPSDTDLPALIAARICHDLISPLGAIGNGVELLEWSKTPGLAPNWHWCKNSV